MLPQHPPEILCGLGQRSLRGDVGLLLPVTDKRVLTPAPWRWVSAAAGGLGELEGPCAAGSRTDNAGDGCPGLARDSGEG